MGGIPEKIPTVFGDRLVLAMDGSGAGKFVISMELVFGGTLDADRLAAALELMMDAEPVLGCRMVPDPKLPYWQRLSNAERINFTIAQDEAGYLQFRNSPLDCLKGPQLQACLLRQGQGDKLILKVAHQVSDAGGVKDIAAKLSAIYNRLAAEPDYKPEPNLTGCRDLGQVLRRVPLWAYPIIFVNFMRQNWSNTVPAITHHLQIPAGPLEPLTYVVKHIPAERTEKIAALGKKHYATINDVLVAAHYWALVKETTWDGKSALRLQTTIDLRRWYLPDEMAEGIGNPSVYEYPNLGHTLGKNFVETVELVSRRTRSRKKSWIGLTDVCLGPVLKLLSFESQQKLGIKIMEQLSKRNIFPNALTNMGEIKPAAVNFGMEPLQAYLLTPFVMPPLFGGGLSGYKGELTLCAGVPVYESGIIDRFYESVLAQLP